MPIGELVAGVDLPDVPVVVGAYTRPVVRYVLSFLVLCQAAGCGDNTSPTSPTTPTATQVAGNRARDGFWSDS